MSGVESQRRIPFERLDVFTASRFGGNQLAVFTDACSLTDAEMQSLAAEMNLSETTFVLPPENPANSARIRFFHPSAEMPFAGHPTLGTGVLLAHLGHPHGDSLLRRRDAPHRGSQRGCHRACITRPDGVTCVHCDQAASRRTLVAADPCATRRAHSPADVRATRGYVAGSGDRQRDVPSAAGVEIRRPSALRVTAARTADGIRATVSRRCVQVLAGCERI